MSHNFQEVKDSTKIEKGAMVRRWHCSKCDSIVQFDVRVTNHEVNRIMQAGLKCLPPLEYTQPKPSEIEIAKR